MSRWLFFISYRVTSERHVALFLRGRLEEHFGAGSVFRDVDSLRAGEDYRAAIVRALAGVRMLLAVIGAGWTEVCGPDGRRRLDNSGDWVRLEIATALRTGITVVPVLVDDARLPTRAELPADLAGLAYRQAVRLRNDSADADADRLVADLAAQVPRPDAVRGPRPAQLPPDPAEFTGRASELDQLDAMLSGEPGRAVVCAVAGTAGVGKTTLAVRWAQRVRDRFADGQLYVNLYGHGPGEPLPTSQALSGFLRALGIEPTAVPQQLEEAAALYRTLLDGRRVLVVLDNAASPEQVRPLLPAAPGCMALVTSRGDLAGLVARDGARRLQLDLLPEPEAIGLLRRALGAERADAEPDAVVELARRCACLPLALRVAAERANRRRHSPLADLVSELGDEARRLDLLDAGGDPQTAVRTVLSWSYHALPGDTAGLFRRLGLFPGPTVSRHAAAAVSGIELDKASVLLDILATGHLVEEVGPGRYRMHDLLRVYAAERAAIEDDPGDRRAALTDLLDWYRYTAAVAMDVLNPGRHRLPDPLPEPACPAPDLPDYDCALSWLEAERANLVAVTRFAEREWDVHAWQLPHILWHYFYQRDYHDDWLLTHEVALAAARRLHDAWAEAEALTYLSLAQWRAGRSAGVVDQLTTALRLRVGDRRGEATTLLVLGVVHTESSRFPEALDVLERAAAANHEVGQHIGEASAHDMVGNVYRLLGHLDEALDHHERAVDIVREFGDRRDWGTRLNNLGNTYEDLGRHEDARACYEEDLQISREYGDRRAETVAVINLACLESRLGRFTEALDLQAQAVSHARAVGGPHLVCGVLNEAGAICLAAGEAGSAMDYHREALSVATLLGDRFESARAHDGLARALHATGAAEKARVHWSQALDLFTELGVPHAEQVREQLAGPR